MWATLKRRPGNKLFRAGLLLLFGLPISACKHGEPYAQSQELHPQICVHETPSPPLPDDLVVHQDAPQPVMSLAQQQSAAIASDLHPVTVQLSPAMQTPSLVVPAAYPPARTGLSQALEHYREHRNDEAVAALRNYPREDQETALVMLPLLARIDQGENWSTLNGPQKLAILESLRDLVKRLSRTAPLVLQHVALVEEQPLRYGEAKLRASANYYPEDWVHAYAELVNLQDRANADGIHQVKLEVSLELHGPMERIYWTDTKPFEKSCSTGSRNDYHVAASFNLPKQLVPGSYQLHIQVTDRETNRVARQTLPLQILESRSKPTGSRRK